MPGTVDSKVGDNLGNASRSGPVNSIPIDSTKPRGATDPSRATITSHGIFSSPFGVSSVSQPGSTFFGWVSVRIAMKPLSPASIMSDTFLALARAKSFDRFRMVTVFSSASSATPSAFSIPASPDPTTVMCRSLKSSGSST